MYRDSAPNLHKDVLWMYVMMHIENHHIYLDKFIQITILRVMYYESSF